MSQSSILLVSSQTLSVWQKENQEEYLQLESLKWSSDPTQILIDSLLPHLKDQIKVLFSPEIVYLISISLIGDSKDEISDLIQLLRTKIPENIEDLTWGYRLAQKNDQQLEYEVFAPLPKWWLPLQAQFAFHKIKTHSLWPQLGYDQPTTKSILSTLKQPPFHLIFSNRLGNVHPNHISEPTSFQDLTNQTNIQKTSVDQSQNLSKSKHNWYLIIIFLVAFLGILLIGWTVLNK